MKATGARLNDFVSRIWYRQPAPQDAGAYDVSGMMDVTAIAARLQSPQNQFYLCGLLGFMQHVVAQLRDAGVDNARIHYELLGPHNKACDSAIKKPASQRAFLIRRP